MEPNLRPTQNFLFKRFVDQCSGALLPDTQQGWRAQD